MNSLFPYANLLAGSLLLLIGFGFHWVGQLISLVNWKLATRLGLQEKEMPPEYRVYEHAIAVADVSIGWIYGVVGLGLLLDKGWAYSLAWIPATILVYHAISAWVWEGNRRAAGHGLWSDTMRLGWCGANLFMGLLTLMLAWYPGFRL